MVLPVHNLHRLPAQEADTIEPTIEALLNNVQPMQDALAAAQENIRLAQNKQKQLYAQRQLHGADDKGKGITPGSVPAAAVTTPTTLVAIAPVSTPVVKATPVATTLAARAAVAQEPVTTAGTVQPATTPAPATFLQAIDATEVASRSAAAPTAGGKRAAPEPIAVKPGDFVLVKIRARGRPAAKTFGKLAFTTEGPYYLASFTDDTKLVAHIEDAEGKTWKRRTDDLCAYMGDA